MRVKKPKLYTCKYKPCKKKFEREREGMICCSVECAMAKAKVDVAKETKKEEARIKREFYENDKTLSNWMDELQNLVNTIIRFVDYKQPCIATAFLVGKKSAGHFWERTQVPHIRYHLDNLHLQSYQSNRWKRGDLMRYREGLEYVYGLDYLKRVEALKEIPAPEFTIEFIREKIPVARKIVKELRKTEKVYSTEERIELRTRFNNELGIYNL